MPDVDVATNFFLVLTVAADAVVVFAVLCGLAALVSSGADKTIRVWDLATAKEVAHAALADVSGVAWVDANQVVSAAARRVMIWKLPEAGKTEREEDARDDR